MSELAAEEILHPAPHPPASRYNRAVAYGYAGYSFTSAPALDPVPESEEDVFHTLGPGEAFRPDLVADRFYQDVNLWWFVMLANEKELKGDGTLNLLERFRPGVTLRIPPQHMAYSYANHRR